jgi:hypothetical protein
MCVAAAGGALWRACGYGVHAHNLLLSPLYTRSQLVELDVPKHRLLGKLTLSRTRRAELRRRLLTHRREKAPPSA